MIGWWERSTMAAEVFLAVPSAPDTSSAEDTAASPWDDCNESRP